MAKKARKRTSRALAKANRRISRLSGLALALTSDRAWERNRANDFQKMADERGASLDFLKATESRLKIEVERLTKELEGQKSVVIRLSNSGKAKVQVIKILARMLASYVNFSEIQDRITESFDETETGVTSADHYLLEQSLVEGYTRGVSDSAAGMFEKFIDREIK